MNSSGNWLNEVVILNDNDGKGTGENVPGEVSIHRSEGDALSAIEPWSVKEGQIFAFNGVGERLVLGLGSSGEVIILRREECIDGRDIVRGWLTSLTQQTVEGRAWVSRKGKAVLSRYEEDQILPTTIEGMLAYIAFPSAYRRDWIAPGCMLLLAVNALLLFLALRKLF